MVETSNTRITRQTEMMSPNEVKSRRRIEEETTKEIELHRNEIANIMNGDDPRMAVVVGPCSIHTKESALAYAERVKEMQKQYENLKLIMRVYFEKPRTTIGWKGLINDPHLDGSFDINTGLILARNIFADIAEMSIPVGTEQLDLNSPQYTSDLVSWSAIGARTTESQGHREMGSGLSSPVGYKNGTGGSTDIAIDAIKAATHPHSFIGINEEGRSTVMHTTGNSDAHIILRGGGGHVNYQLHSVESVASDMARRGIKPRIMVDASHQNAPKGYMQQIAVVRDLISQMEEGSRLVQAIMLESHIKAGKQTFKVGDTQPNELDHEMSITDACIGIEDTQIILDELNDAVGRRNVA